MRILHLDENHPFLADSLAKAGFINEFDYLSDKTAVENKIANYQGLVIRSRFPIDKTFIDKASNLKFIARVGAGLENIDVTYAQQKGISLLAAPEGNRNAVGEHSLGMLLSLMNHFVRANSQVRNGVWLREENRGYELDGLVVGIIGYGNTGKSFARKLKGFNCTVFCYDILDNVGDENATQVSLQTLQEMAQVLSLHVPLTDLTRYMVDADFINAFRNPFWFINTARGKCVRTDHLVDSLRSGKVLGAGLDVLEYEKSSFESLFLEDKMPEAMNALIQMDNVLLTPHIGGWTAESKKKLAEVLVEKIINEFGR